MFNSLENSQGSIDFLSSEFQTSTPISSVSFNAIFSNVLITKHQNNFQQKRTRERSYIHNSISLDLYPVRKRRKILKELKQNNDVSISYITTNMHNAQSNFLTIYFRTLQWISFMEFQIRRVQ